MNIVRDRTRPGTEPGSRSPAVTSKTTLFRKEVANMWTRKSVKAKGKKSFFQNFWKCVLVGLILSIIIGAASSGGGGAGSMAGNSGGVLGGILSESEDDQDVVVGDTDIDVDLDLGDDDDHGVTVTYDVDDNDGIGFAIMAFLIGFAFAFVISLIATAIALAIKYFLLTPFEYGCRKFFRKNLDEPAKLSNIVYVFDSHYKNIIKTAFMKDLFVFLWSLLFVIPGIIKSYEYRMVPYIMSEDPTMNYKDALAESKKLMTGNKWKTFVLDLSFIGWDILSAMTLGFLEIFFVAPYKASTEAALYETLKYGIDAK